MAEDGQLLHVMDRSGPEPTLAESLDLAAVVGRLREARARRAATISRRGFEALDGDGQPKPPLASPPIPHPATTSALGAAPVDNAAHADAAASTSGRRTATPLSLIFLAGLGLGGAAVAVVVLRPLPARIAPVASAEPMTAAPVAPSSAPPDISAQLAALPGAVPADKEPASPPRFLLFATPRPAALAEPALPVAGTPVTPLPARVEADSPDETSQRASPPRRALSAADVKAALATRARRTLSAADVQAALVATAARPSRPHSNRHSR